MKEGKSILEKYQELVGKIILGVAIIIAACIIANAIVGTGMEIHGALGYLGELVRDGLLQVGSAS